MSFNPLHADFILYNTHKKQTFTKGVMTKGKYDEKECRITESWIIRTSLYSCT